MEQSKLKVNLLTFNSALSYGAVLQTYALVTALENLNCEVELIDFRAPFLPAIPTGIWSLRHNYNLSRIKKELLFRKFRKEHLSQKTKALYSENALTKFPFNADYYIVGSDQVWNPDITKKYAKFYFFDFIKGNKISYAASFGKEVWDYNESFTREISDLLTDFNAISVRETQGIGILNENFGLQGVTVLDPTLLNPDFSLILPDYIKKEQIAAISVNNNPLFIQLVFKVQQKLKVPAYVVDLKIKGDQIIPVTFPQVKDWIRYIAESSFIVTDSFHGVALSIIYHKKFVVVNANPKRFVRIKDLLNKLELQHRIISSQKDIIENNDWLTPINYKAVDMKLEKLREDSLNFLKSALLNR